jgi:hypothetical protein
MGDVFLPGSGWLPGLLTIGAPGWRLRLSHAIARGVAEDELPARKEEQDGRHDYGGHPEPLDRHADCFHGYRSSPSGTTRNRARFRPLRFASSLRRSSRAAIASFAYGVAALMRPSRT